MWELEQEIKDDGKKTSVKMPQQTELELELRTLMLNAIEKYRLYIFPEAYRIIKNKLLFSWDIRNNNKRMWRENCTAAVYPLTESTVDTFTANLYDSVVMPKVSARKPEDVEQAELAQDFCDRANDVANSSWAKKLIRNEAALIWTSYWMAWRNKRTERSKYTINGKDNKEFVHEIDEPTLEFVSFFELFCDLSTTNFYRARWKARRKILSLSEIKRRYDQLITFTPEIEQRIKDTVWNELSKFDFTKIYDIKNYDSCWERNYDWRVSARDELSFIEDNVLLSITDKNPLLELIEYREDDKLVIMINWFIYYDWLSPYPFWQPFWVVVYEELPWTYMWRGIWHKISTLQQQATSLYCKIRDAVNQHIAPMYSVVKWMISKDQSWQTSQTITYVPWKMIQVESPDVKNWWITPIDFVDFNMVQIARDELASVISRAQEIVWTNSYVQWWQGKVERSGIAANLKVWVTKTRLKPIESSMQAFDQHIFEQRLALASMSEKDELVVRVVWKDWYKYSTIKPSDLINKYDITVDIDWLVEQTRLQRTQEAIQLLQAIAPININPISQTPIINPDSIISYIAEQTWNSALKWMDVEERIAYAKEHLDIASKLKWLAWSPSPEWWQQQQMQGAALPPDTQQQQVDLPWFFDNNGASVG